MSAPSQDKVDFIPRIKSLTAQIQECLNVSKPYFEILLLLWAVSNNYFRNMCSQHTTRTAAQSIAVGNLVDSGSL